MTEKTELRLKAVIRPEELKSYSEQLILARTLLSETPTRVVVIWAQDSDLFEAPQLDCYLGAARSLRIADDGTFWHLVGMVFDGHVIKNDNQWQLVSDPDDPRRPFAIPGYADLWIIDGDPTVETISLAMEQYDADPPA
jgi:hypothetical protein